MANKKWRALLALLLALLCFLPTHRVFILFAAPSEKDQSNLSPPIPLMAETGAEAEASNAPPQEEARYKPSPTPEGGQVAPPVAPDGTPTTVPPAATDGAQATVAPPMVPDGMQATEAPPAAPDGGQATAAPLAPGTNAAGIPITAKSAVLIEGSTGTVLMEQNKDEQLVPASITKIMTLILIFEALHAGKFTLTDKVTVSEYAASMGGSQVYLEPNEEQTVDDMIKCISIASANDASVAMAEFVYGSEGAFVTKMNEKAQQLGMTNTHFLNCSGLDDDIESGHYSSAYDVALMSRELVTKYPEISKYSTVWMDSITHITKKGESQFDLTNTNKLVRTYSGITGLKTGSTDKAKYCVSTTANRNGMDLIAVVMAAPDYRVRFSEAASILDYGFANCSLYKDEHADFQADPIPVNNGLADAVPICPRQPFTYTCLKGENTNEIVKELQLVEEVNAPIREGDAVGQLVYSLNGVELGRMDMVAMANVEKAKFIDYYFKMLRRFFLSK